MKNPTTLWNGYSWETLELEDALSRVADGTGQITDIDVGAHRLLTPDEFTKRRAMIAGKKKPGYYKTTEMKAEK